MLPNGKSNLLVPGASGNLLSSTGGGALQALFGVVYGADFVQNSDAGFTITSANGGAPGICFEDGGDLGNQARIGKNSTGGAAWFVGFGGDVDNAWQMGTRAAEPTQLFTADACRVHVDAGGHIGINTITPRGVLDVCEISGGGFGSLFLDGPSGSLFRLYTNGTGIGAFFTGFNDAQQLDYYSYIVGGVVFSIVPAGGFVHQTPVTFNAKVNPSGNTFAIGGSIALGDSTTQTTAYPGASPAQFIAFRAAIARVLTGVGDATILVAGDSITAGSGSGSTPLSLNGYPNRLSQLFAANGIPSSAGGGIAPNTTVPTTYDTRWTVGSGWGVSNFGPAGLGAWNGAPTTGDLVFTPSDGVVYDSARVLVFGNSGTTTITMTGGTPVVTPSTGGQGYFWVTVHAASAATTNTITIVGTVFNVFIMAIVPYLSTTPRLNILNAGSPGATTGNWATSAGSIGGLGFISAVAADLTLILLTTNDAIESVAASTVSANLALMITAAEASGDVTLSSSVPCSQVPAPTFQAAYTPVFLALAAQSGVGFVDTFGRYGGAWQTTLMSDYAHPNALGYSDVASGIELFASLLK